MSVDATRLTTERLEKMRPFNRDVHPVDAPDLPPGPSWPPLLQTVALLRLRHWFVPRMHAKYGDTFTVRLLPRSRPMVIFSRPEHAKEIFAGDPAVFHAGKANAILGPMMGEHSLLLQDGAEHARARKLLMPAFNGRALKSYRDLVGEVARTEVSAWGDGEEFASLDRMNRLTLEVILRVVFGVSDGPRLTDLRPRVNRVVDVSPAIMIGTASARLRRLKPWREAVANTYALDELIYDEIAERRTAPDLETRTDVLSSLIQVNDGGDQLTDPELRDQLVTLLLAGHETTATALAWALHELGRDAGQLANARDAADRDDEAYLEAVLKEAMRLHPVIPIVVRTLMAPATVGGLDLPAGVTVGPSIILSHARPENFPHPERFDPTRFLGQSPAPNTWIPFGGGVRRCIGAGFALMEGAVVLGEVLRRWDVTAVGKDRPKVRNITSVPKNGARIRVRAR